MSEAFRNSLKLCISSTSTVTESDGTKYTIFNVSVACQYSVFEVPRRFRQFDALNIELVQLSARLGIAMPAFPKKHLLGNLQNALVEERRQSLQDYLVKVCMLPNALSMEPLVRFLELSMPLQISKMSSDISMAFTEISRNTDGIQELLRRVQVLESQQLMQYSQSNENSRHDLHLLTDRDSGGSMLSREVIEHKAMSGESLPLSPKHGYFIAQVLGMDQEVSSAEKGALLTNGKNMNGVASLSGEDQYDELVGASIPTTERDEQQQQEPAVRGLPAVREDSALESILAMQDIKQRLMTLLGGEEGPLINSQWDGLAEEVVYMMQPQDVQVNYRVSASKYVSRHARKTLGAFTYEVGLQALRCFLPDDPIRMSVFLSRSDESGWYVRLNEQMCRLSGGVASVKAEGEPGSSSSSSAAHVLSNVSFVTNNEISGHKLQCLVDSSLGVEVLANVRLELCLVAFFEDFDRVMGRDHLFKRCIILIRTWWLYEANMSSSCGISDSAFCTMILSILNRYHERIHHPFQALCVFLAEYSSLNFSSHVITIHGPVEIDSYMKAGAVDNSSSLITTAFLNRYRKLTLAVDEDESSTMELLSETIGDDSLSDALFASNRLQANSSDIKTVCAFAVKPIMIAHPLLPGMIFDCPTPILQRKSGFIVESFRTGAKALLPLLSVDDNDNSVNRHSMIDSFFKNSTARFGRGWRPDTPASPSLPVESQQRNQQQESATMAGMPLTERAEKWSVDSSPFASIDLSRENSFNRFGEDGFSDLMVVNLDKTWDKIRYCNLILESQISEPALKTLSRLVLIDKGPLPVGEIGKMLQDACSVVSTMSTVLKERFGGLKKFLERHPDDFVLANDHPFNPNVYLRDTLSLEEYGALLRGETLSRLSSSSHQVTGGGGSKPRNRRNSRNSVDGRKKSPAPTLPLSPEQYGLMPPASAGNTFSRTLSNNSLDMINGGGNNYRPARLNSDLVNSTPLPNEWDNRIRTKSTPVSDKALNNQYRGILGMPDPSAPEFIPWGKGGH